MRYLFDVNALLALGLLEHEFHPRVRGWVGLENRDIATCSITELGFVRVLSNARPYGLSVAEALSLFQGLKSSKNFTLSFIGDHLGAANIPRWVRNSSQLTDGHLLELAASSGAVFATLDANVPGAFLIPERP